MAYLLNPKLSIHCYLLSHHSFGRLPYTVNTVINKPEISKIHAVIEWEQEQWMIRDISKNGTWLNNKKLNENKKYKLSIKDKICFGEKKASFFQVIELEPPCDVLTPQIENENFPVYAIPLKDYTILPSEMSPEVVIYRDQQKLQWCIETVDHVEHNNQILDEGSTIKFNNQYWRVQLNKIEVATKKLSLPKTDIERLEFIFFSSLDEENIHLKIKTPNMMHDLGTRIHHYLTMILARYRALDSEKGLDHLSQGWVYTEQLATDLGIDISHLNIQIHRARKQFVDRLDNVINSEHLIERRPGELRLGGSAFKIYKGENLECQLNSKSDKKLAELL